MYEQLDIFSIIGEQQENLKRIEENKCLGEPCKSCDVRWGSIQCFLRRGFIWDPVNRFIKDENGKKLRYNMEKRECKKVYSGEE